MLGVGQGHPSGGGENCVLGVSRVVNFLSAWFLTCTFVPCHAMPRHATPCQTSPQHATPHRTTSYLLGPLPRRCDTSTTLARRAWPKTSL